MYKKKVNISLTPTSSVFSRRILLSTQPTPNVCNMHTLHIYTCLLTTIHLKSLVHIPRASSYTQTKLHQLLTLLNLKNVVHIVFYSLKNIVMWKGEILQTNTSIDMQIHLFRRHISFKCSSYITNTWYLQENEKWHKK